MSTPLQSWIELQLARDITLTGIANDVGVSLATVSCYRSGKRRPNARDNGLLERLRLVTGLTTEDLLRAPQASKTH